MMKMLLELCFLTLFHSGTWVPCDHRTVCQVADGSDCFRIWRVAAKIQREQKM
jgi:hypothetical protein